MAKKKLPVPLVTVSSWTEPDDNGDPIEKGIALSWKLPADADGMLVQVGDYQWGPFLDQEHVLKIAYPKTGDTPLPVKLQYAKIGEPLAFNILDNPNDINLILADIILTGYVSQQEKDDFDPASEYPDDLYEAFDTGGGFWEIRHSDKYSGSAKYRGVRVSITHSGTSVACVVRPGLNGQDTLLTAATLDPNNQPAFSDLLGTFTNSTGSVQKYTETGAFGASVKIYTFRDTDRDQLVIRIYGAASNWTVTAKVHRYS